jgi:hypothetical protein
VPSLKGLALFLPFTPDLRPGLMNAVASRLGFVGYTPSLRQGMHSHAFFQSVLVEMMTAKSQRSKRCVTQKHYVLQSAPLYSTVTDLARFLGWSTSQPRRTAM